MRTLMLSLSLSACGPTNGSVGLADDGAVDEPAEEDDVDLSDPCPDLQGCIIIVQDGETCVAELVDDTPSIRQGSVVEWSYEERCGELDVGLRGQANLVDDNHFSSFSLSLQRPGEAPEVTDMTMPLSVIDGSDLELRQQWRGLAGTDDLVVRMRWYDLI